MCMWVKMDMFWRRCNVISRNPEQFFVLFIFLGAKTIFFLD